VKLEKGARSSIQGVKKDIYNKTSIGSIWLGQGDKSRSRYIRVYNKRSVIDKIWKQKVKASSLYLKIIE